MNINFKTQRILNYNSDESKPIKVSVHDFIQTVVFNPFPQNSELQVERLTLAGNIYESIGFKRKAAFYRRFAALKSVTVQSDWQACYDALLDSLEGFGLTLDPIKYEKSLSDNFSSVWPGLHVQLMEELITCCKRIQNTQAGILAIRHMSFILHTLDLYLSNTKKKDLAKELEEASTIFGEDSPVPLTLNSGFVVPTVNLTRYPLCSKLEPLQLPFPLRPIRLKCLKGGSLITSTSDIGPDNPFIFTPITNHSSLMALQPRRTASNSLVTDVIWVQDEPCSTVMVLNNTFQFELAVTSIKLLTDGVPLETRSSSLIMEPNETSNINLIGIPRQLTRSDGVESVTNKIEIFGYSTHVLGVKSICRLDMIPKSRFPNQYIVEVCPPLPKLEFDISNDLNPGIVIESIPECQVDKDLVALDIMVELKSKEKVVYQLIILNSSKVEIEYLFINEKQQRQFVHWDESILDGLRSNPLKPGQKLKLPITISLSDSIFSKSNLLSTILEMDYSGGLALKEMFCRKCAIRIGISQSCYETQTSQQLETEREETQKVN